ncbi:alpha/beta hydrolase fold domain-containing protein [Streptomyces sp. NPDC001388]|uniref:alpha/beta hydrolase fold domain-containing protein n=1 Tax=Streptomyces sp. NPDC001388 TaxID=3364568 RepID=UPI0036A12E21
MDGEPLAVGGDSAGGTVAACAALARRDRDQPLTAQVPACPPLARPRAKAVSPASCWSWRRAAPPRCSPALVRSTGPTPCA